MRNLSFLSSLPPPPHLSSFRKSSRFKISRRTRYLRYLRVDFKFSKDNTKDRQRCTNRWRRRVPPPSRSISGHESLVAFERLFYPFAEILYTDSESVSSNNLATTNKVVGTGREWTARVTRYFFVPINASSAISMRTHISPAGGERERYAFKVVVRNKTQQGVAVIKRYECESRPYLSRERCWWTMRLSCFEDWKDNPLHC